MSLNQILPDLGYDFAIGVDLVQQSCSPDGVQWLAVLGVADESRRS